MMKYRGDRQTSIKEATFFDRGLEIISFQQGTINQTLLIHINIPDLSI